MKRKLMSFDWIVNSLIVHNLLSCVTVFCSYWQMFFKLGDLKVELSPSKKKLAICLIGSSLKMMKNAFYFILKTFFIPKISFCHNFFVISFGHIGKNSLIRKIRLTSKFMTSQTGLQTIAIHILPNISTRQWNLVN